MGAALVYDVTDPSSLAGLAEWNRALEENTSQGQIVSKIVVANKSEMKVRIDQ